MSTGAADALVGRIAAANILTFTACIWMTREMERKYF